MSEFAPLYGLVLAGGQSRRMGRDKAVLEYRGVPQALWTARLLATRCPRVFFSCRAGQDLGDSREFPRIHDDIPGAGPLGGMITAATCHPHVAWLVAACDLPCLTPTAIDDLLLGRAGDATAYRGAKDGLPEPLFTIYEPAFAPIWRQAMAQGCRCPRKILMDQAARVTLLTLRDPRALDNANTPQDYERFVSVKTITLNYFAHFREKAGCARETIETELRTLGELYAHLQTRHGFGLDSQYVRVAIGATYASLADPIPHEAEVTFIPPVAGG
jgi:molybdopterin-guanine dinucleotide biosynthesis protein A